VKLQVLNKGFNIF